MDGSVQPVQRHCNAHRGSLDRSVGQTGRRSCDDPTRSGDRDRARPEEAALRDGEPSEGNWLRHADPQRGRFRSLCRFYCVCQFAFFGNPSQLIRGNRMHKRAIIKTVILISLLRHPITKVLFLAVSNLFPRKRSYIIGGLLIFFNEDYNSYLSIRVSCQYIKLYRDFRNLFG